jgi:D-alanyl-D-alanine carboxypeptidase
MQTNIAGRHVAMIFLDAPNKSARNSDVEKLRDWLMSPGSFQTASR